MQIQPQICRKKLKDFAKNWQSLPVNSSIETKTKKRKISHKSRKELYRTTPKLLPNLLTAALKPIRVVDIPSSMFTILLHSM